LYDGFLPAPQYRWVHPPAERVNDYEPALTGTAVVPIDPLGLSLSGEIQTEDEQADVTFPSGVVAIQPGQVSVRVEIFPMDPGG
jgi:hypothetical protein